MQSAVAHATTVSLFLAALLLLFFNNLTCYRRRQGAIRFAFSLKSQPETPAILKCEYLFFFVSIFSSFFLRRLT